MSSGGTDRPFDPRKALDPDFVPPEGAEPGGPGHYVMTKAVEGWRAWKVERQLPPFGTPPKLRSATYSAYYWTPRKAAEADCESCRQRTVTDPTTGNEFTEGEGIPGENCACGFYSAKTKEHLLGMGYHHYDELRDYFCVLGRVANWGKVIEGSQGWRSQFSYPIELFVPYEVAATFGKPLASAYGVPVRLMNFLVPTHAEAV